MASLNMLTSALKNLFSKPACLMYPVVPRIFVKGARGKLEIDIATCIYCGICQRKCPTQAIVVTRIKPAKPGEPLPVDKSSWELNPLRCVSCGACVEVCPKASLQLNSATYKSAMTEKTKEVHTNA